MTFGFPAAQKVGPPRNPGYAQQSALKSPSFLRC